MIHPNAIERKDNQNCATCDYSESCLWVKDIDMRERHVWICRHYANDEKGRFVNAKDLVKVSKK